MTYCCVFKTIVLSSRTIIKYLEQNTIQILKSVAIKVNASFFSNLHVRSQSKVYIILLLRQLID